jgi:hypothetical protein
MSTRELEMARLAELAVERWLDGLASPESVEFETLRARYPSFAVDSLEEVAACLGVTPSASPVAVPERVRMKLAEGADNYFGPRATPSASVAANDRDREATTDRRRLWLSYGGWLTAAASLLLAVTLWVKRPVAVEVAGSTAAPAAAAKTGELPAAPSGEVATVNHVPERAASTTPGSELIDSAVERAQFMKTHAWLVQRSWLPGTDPTGEAVSGDVVWDANSQTGYMRFHRLRRNDPNVEQYQLWIFDARRDERFPVDGGVFNVSNAEGDEVVRFSARLKVEVPLMFVVTVERRGGVVVSDRSRVSAIAHTS